MKLSGRLKLVVSCLLAVLLVGGTALPSPAVWQCRYSSRIVSAAFVPAPSAMPCLTDAAMASMPCCHSLKPIADRSLHGKQALSHSPCHPTLTRLAAVPALGMTEASFHLRQSLLAFQAVVPVMAAFAVSAPITLPLRQRPPPTLGSSLSAPAYSFGLHAPPAA